MELKRDIYIGIVEKEQETSWNVGVCLCYIHFTVDVSGNAETSPHHTA